MENKNWSTKATWGMVCGIASLFFVPILLGPAGIIMGVQAKNEGDVHGDAVWITSLVCMLLGVIGGAFVGLMIAAQ